MSCLCFHVNLTFKTGELFLWVGIKDVMCIWYPFQNTEKLSKEVYSVCALISAFHCEPGVRETRS